MLPRASRLVDPLLQQEAEMGEGEDSMCPSSSLTKLVQKSFGKHNNTV